MYFILGFCCALVICFIFNKKFHKKPTSSGVLKQIQSDDETYLFLELDTDCLRIDKNNMVHFIVSQEKQTL